MCRRCSPGRPARRSSWWSTSARTSCAAGWQRAPGRSRCCSQATWRWTWTATWPEPHRARRPWPACAAAL
eukprot:10381157-Lingulodinium_polyedra.AAC.1